MDTGQDKFYLAQMTGKPWTKTFWAGQNINNLSESLKDVAMRGELRSIRNVDASIEEYVLNLMGEAKGSGQSW